MRFVYPARLRRTGPDEVVVSFRDLPECLTSGADEAEAITEAADALGRSYRWPHRAPACRRRPDPGAECPAR